MRHVPLVFLSAFVLPLSCESVPRPTRNLGYAQATPTAFSGLDLESYEFDDASKRNVESAEGTPMVFVEARFLKAEPGFGMSGSEDDPPPSFRKLPRKEVERLLGEEADGRAKQMAAPTLTTYSGQLTYTLVVNQQAYIRDFEMRPVTGGDGVPTPHPVIGVLNTGAVVQLRPFSRGDDGDDVEIRELSAAVVEHIGERTCRGVVVQKDATYPLFWQEPIVLSGKPDEGLPESLTLEPGEALLVPLRYRVEQAAANARAYVLAGTVEETYAPVAGTSDATSPMNHECVVLITARRVTDEDRGRDP